ncbi:MAG: adenylate/guanylate cyclase domain-containing protein [Candidatus Binataceae bacterium]
MAHSDFERLVAAARILVVDDEIFNCRLVERFLHSLGYSNVVTTNDPREVRELQLHHDFDLVLLDVEMPYLSGFEVIEILNTHRRHDDYLPILVFTGHQDRDVRLRALASGAKDFLTKPLEPAEATHRIRNLLEVRILHNMNRIERDRYQDLLGSILPGPIIRRLRNGETRIADRLDDASVLFSDLVGFTAYSANREPSEVVDALTGLFSEFDALAKHHDLEKIKTIGDAYMVVGGLAPDDHDHAPRMADLALSMVMATANNKHARKAGFRIRIGLHRGPIIAGLLGGARSTYDVWGDTINTASRFESTSLPGRTNISEAFAAAVRNEFFLEPRGKIALAGKGELDAYFLGERRAPVRHKAEHSFSFTRDGATAAKGTIQ